MLTANSWIKSTRSYNNGACVEARLHGETAIEVRDSKDPAGPTLVFSHTEWANFLQWLNRPTAG